METLPTRYMSYVGGVHWSPVEYSYHGPIGRMFGDIFTTMKQMYFKFIYDL